MATSTKRPRRLLDAYRFPGLRPQATVKGVFGDPKARVITLVRRGKKQSAGVVASHNQVGMTASSGASATCPVVTPGSGWRSKCVGLIAGLAAR
jgi:hypothetical protein